jgi:hypothetical protein
MDTFTRVHPDGRRGGPFAWAWADRHERGGALIGDGGVLAFAEQDAVGAGYIVAPGTLLGWQRTSSLHRTRQTILNGCSAKEVTLEQDS